LGYTDDAVSRYYERLKSEFGSDLSVVVTGDHGEGFWDHASFDAEHFQDSRPAYCVGHGGTPYECVTRVPLWMDEIDTSTSGLGSLIDLAPTILNQFGLEDELQTTGKPLSESVSPERIVVTEGARYGHEKKAVYRNGWKIIRSHGDETTVEFEVDEEPETTTIPSGERRAMIEAFPPWPDGQSSKERHVSRAVENRLRDLGYQ
jgi:arylsulfatase A-like enzyme